MAIHNDPVSMLKESLPEYLLAAEICINFRKPNGGCLGYPAAAFLLSIADVIGSFYRGNTDFVINIDGKERQIRNTAEHFDILNSDYYGQHLTSQELGAISRDYRNLLSHNALVAENSFLEIGDAGDTAFDFRQVLIWPGKDPLPVVVIRLIPFLRLSQIAVDSFLKKAPDIVPKSLLVQEMSMRARRS